MIRVFIGFDSQEPVSYHVAAHSLMRHASKPVAVTPLYLPQLPLTRARDPRQSTDFAFSRFLVPYLCGFEGHAIFVDCDVLFRADVAELWAQRPLDAAVSVVKHNYTPRDGSKFLEHEQTAYAKKNWSSVMVFNCAECRSLSPYYVNSASGLDLHQFKWLRDEQIAALTPDWNHLVGEYSPNPEADLAHFTLGTPCFARYRDCEFAREWFEERDLMTFHERRNEYSRPVRSEPFGLSLAAFDAQN